MFVCYEFIQFTYQFYYKISIDHFDVHMLKNPRTIYHIIYINLIYTYAQQSNNNKLYAQQCKNTIL